MRSWLRAALWLGCAACAGCGGAPQVAPSASTATVGGANATMTIVVTRSSAAAGTTSIRRMAETIPFEAAAVDAQVWSGTTTVGSAIATSCVAFATNAASATLSISVPQGQLTMRIASWSGACSPVAGGQGAVGSGSILSSFTGSGTVNASSTDIGAVFNGGSAIGLTPAPLPTGTGSALNGPGTGPSSTGHAWGPPAVAQALQFPVQRGFDGSGQTVAILSESNFAVSDLTAFEAYFETPATARTVTELIADDASSAPDGALGQAETTLDVETVAGLAPGANVVLYVMKDLTEQSEVDALDQILSTRSAGVVNMSFSGCEPAGIPTLSTLLSAGASQGITFVAATGDTGSACYTGTVNGVDQYAAGVGYPASDPNVIGVGGNETYPSATLTNPVVWNDTHQQGNAQAASGGGVSSLFTLPSYQSGLAGLASAQYRNVPDVAMPASYVAMYELGTWHVAGGTSWSAPQFAAMVAEVAQYCTSAFLAGPAMPYRVFDAFGYDAFITIASGTNAYQDGTSLIPGYTAVANQYSNATGIGLPEGMPLAQALCPNRAPAAFVRAPATLSALALRGANGAVTLDVTPRVRGLVDAGPRAAAAATRIQLVLRPTADVATGERTVIDALQNAGFTIERTFANHLVIDASGPAGTVTGFFASPLRDVVQDRHGTRYLPTAPVTIPASIAPYVAGVTLDDVVNAAPPR